MQSKYTKQHKQTKTTAAKFIDDEEDEGHGISIAASHISRLRVNARARARTSLCVMWDSNTDQQQQQKIDPIDPIALCTHLASRTSSKDRLDQFGRRSRNSNACVRMQLECVTPATSGRSRWNVYNLLDFFFNFLSFEATIEWW